MSSESDAAAAAMFDTYHGMTPAKAEALGQLSADLLQVMFNATHATSDLDWTDVVMAATISMRGLAARECNDNPVLPPMVARTMLTLHFAMAMGLPDEVVRVERSDEKGGPDQAGIKPIQRH